MVTPITLIGDPDEPRRSFYHARLKVFWAEQHLKHLTMVVNEFIEENKNAGLAVLDGDGGALTVNRRPINAKIPLLAGDIVFSLRSALDCCWMGLQRAIDTDATKRTLPRAQTAKELVATVNKASIERAFQGSDRLIIDKIRPSQDGNEVLWFGGKVDNWNKHNMLIVSRSMTTIHSMTMDGPMGSKAVLQNVTLIGGNNGMDMLPGHSPDDEANMTFDVVLISSDPIDRRPLMPFVTSLLKETHEAVELFVAAFGKDVPEVTPK